MQKIFFLLTALVLLLSGCSENKEFTIVGEIADKSCDGAQIFLVPLTEPATHETVDSVVIKDRHFQFKGDKARICVLRLQMPQRLNFQELLVYTEPGTITAHVAQIGSVSGTPNNDLLQVWKTRQESCIQARKNAFEAADKKLNDTVYMATVDSLSEVMSTATYELIKNSGLNPFSRFFYAGNRYALNDKHKKELQYMEDDYQHQLDSIRKAKAAESVKK